MYYFLLTGFEIPARANGDVNISTEYYLHEVRCDVRILNVGGIKRQIPGVIAVERVEIHEGR